MMDDVVRSKSPLASAGQSSVHARSSFSPLFVTEYLQSTYLHDQPVSFGHILELLQGKKNPTKKPTNLL